MTRQPEQMAQQSTPIKSIKKVWRKRKKIRNTKNMTIVIRARYNEDVERRQKKRKIKKEKEKHKQKPERGK